MNINTEKTLLAILDFTPNAQRTMEQFLLGFNEKLRAKKWRTVYVFSGAPGEDFRSRLRALDSPYLLAEFPLSWGHVPSLVAELGRYRPCAIQTCFMSPFNVALWRLKRILGARYFIFCDHTSGAATRKVGVKRLLAQLRGAAAGWYVDRIVTVSDFNRRRDIERSYLPPGKIRTIYNGIDTEKFNITDKQDDRDTITIAYVG